VVQASRLFFFPGNAGILPAFIFNVVQASRLFFFPGNADLPIGSMYVCVNPIQYAKRTYPVNYVRLLNSY
jgi:hypothetical protein